MDGICHISKSDLEWPLDFVNIFDLSNTVSNTGMDTHDPVSRRFFVDNSSHWKPIKHIIELVEHTVWIFDVFLKSLCTLLAKSEVLIHISVLVVSS